MSDEENLPRVPAASDLDWQTFIKHYNLRHKADLGYTGGGLPEKLDEYQQGIWRAFHQRIHDGVAGSKSAAHIHNEPVDPDSAWEEK